MFQNAKEFEVVREGEDTILRINYEEVPRVPSLEDDETCMAQAVELLIKNPSATKIIFVQKHHYEYDYAQTRLLSEVAKTYNLLMKNRELFSFQALQVDPNQYNLSQRYNDVHTIIFDKLKKDPLGCYVLVHRMLRHEHIDLEKEIEPSYKKARQSYINVLQHIIDQLDRTRLIAVAQPYLPGLKVGDRSVYRKIFSPLIRPDFMFTKLMATYPKDAEEIDSYKIGDTEVVIFKPANTVQYLYHVTPPEFKLDEDKYEILDMARRIMAEHKPEQQDFVNPERMREVFYNVGHDLLEELANYRNLKVSQEDVEELTQILIRYTVGFGLIEILLRDERVQDITINSPMGASPMFLVHSKYDECETNVIPSVTDAESWASKLRLMSGRPLDEANPILDTEIEIPGVARSRIGVIAPPLNPSGIAYAFRRHRDKPWTLPLFIKHRMINPLAAGLISFLVDGNRTMLIAGTRSAGKSSLLGSLLVEIMRKYRIITIEDTLELPTASLRKQGYNIQPMKVASALSRGTSEVPADEGIRTTLRLGDSALIVGEVRSTEARALYEAMRVGALANVVAGTIHGDSPYGVFDRVVNDLQVPRTSFKATDIIIVANPIRSADGLHRWRRVTQISEIRKDWEDDPVRESGFIDLMKYNAEKDELLPTDDLINGDSDILKAIAGNVKEWAGNWDAVWENIELRAKVKEEIVKAAEMEEDDELLEAPFVIRCNDEFHRISDKVREEVRKLDGERIFFSFQEWLRDAAHEEKVRHEQEHERLQNGNR
ncbi:type II/IV secretion system ATPase subunit [Candidatus Woesearchaeota archaeon]|nr:type II/IV secretion system ATPase subunit [Candidatus Woesearchaeota archaeon]